MKGMSIFKGKGNHEGIPSGRSKLIKILIIVAVIITIIIVAVLIGVSKLSKKVNEADNLIEIEPVMARDLSDSISLKGTVSGDSKTNITSCASAEVTSVSVQLGDTVEKGSSICTLDTSAIQEQIDNLQKNIDSANAISSMESQQKKQALTEAKEDQASSLTKAKDSITKAESSYTTAQTNSKNLDSILATKKTAADNALSSLQKAESDMKSSAATVQSTSADLEANEANDDGTYQTAYDNAVALYTTNKDMFDLATSTYEAAKAEYDEAVIKSETAKSEVTTAKEAVNEAKSTYDELKISTDRTVAAAQNAIDMEKYETSTTEDYQKQLDELKKQLADCTITSPYGGVVTAISISVGDTYAAGQVIATVESNNIMKVVVDVQEADILKIEEGMKAIVTADAIGDTEITGTVTRVVRIKNQSTAMSEDMMPSATGYSAEITIENTDLLVNMSAKARITLSDKGEALAIPYDLIQFDEDGKSFVLTANVNDDGTAKAEKKYVETAEESDYYTEITGGDLVEGDMLIYDYSFTIMDGDTFEPDQMYSEEEGDSNE